MDKRLNELARRFRRQRIIVVGDVMLDRYVCGEVSRISPEAPVPIVDFTQEYCRPGGAANVALNLAALGARVQLFGVVGCDAGADLLRALLDKSDIERSGLWIETDRHTTVKTRIVAANQQVLRVDREDRHGLTPDTKRRLLRTFRSNLGGAAAVIVADYAKGTIDAESIETIIRYGRDAGVPICVDPKPRRALPLNGCAVLTPNRKETFELAGMADEFVGPRPAQHQGLRQAIAIIQQRYEPVVIVVTLGEQGMLVVERDSRVSHIPAVAREVYDISGAGDTVIAVFVLARAAGANPVEAAVLANRAAGVVVGKSGTATLTLAELRRSWLKS